jgi:hypothetical protein
MNAGGGLWAVGSIKIGEQAMRRQILPIMITALIGCSLAQVNAQEADQDSAEEPEVPPCSKAELAADRAAARSYALSTAQLKGLTAAARESAEGVGKPAARRFLCLVDGANDGTTTYILTTGGASRLFGQYPQVAKAYARQALTARDLAMWGQLSPWLAIVASPELAAMAPGVAADAKKQLSAQQSAFAVQNRDGLKAWFDASKKAGR